MLKRLNDLQVLWLSRHHNPATQHQQRKCRIADDLEAFLRTHEHAVFFERLQTVAKQVEAIDLIPLWEFPRWLCACGVLQSCLCAVDVDILGDFVKHEDDGQEESGFVEMVFHGRLQWPGVPSDRRSKKKVMMSRPQPILSTSTFFFQAE